MGQGRLFIAFDKGLALLHVHGEIDLFIDKIVKQYAEMKKKI